MATKQIRLHYSGIKNNKINDSPLSYISEVYSNHVFCYYIMYSLAFFCFVSFVSFICHSEALHVSQFRLYYV